MPLPLNIVGRGFDENTLLGVDWGKPSVLRSPLLLLKEGGLAKVAKRTGFEPVHEM